MKIWERVIDRRLREETTITVRVGLHQGSSLSPYLFDMILDVMGRGIKEQPPWCMLFADDIVLCSTRRDHVERKLEEWRTAMEERGLKISRRKTEYLGCNEHQDAEIQLQGEPLKRVKAFTYLGSTLAEDGELDADVTHRVQSGWKNWKRVSGVLCDRRMNMKIKGKVYRTVVRPALMYGAETWALKKAKENKLEVAEMRMVRWMCGVMKLDKIRNERIKLRSHERFYVSVVDFIWRPTRKKPLGSELVELELGPLQLASDTVIYATAYQRWTADGRRATYHVFRVAIASQWWYSPCSSSFQMRLTYLGRTSLVWTFSQFCRRHKTSDKTSSCERTLRGTTKVGEITKKVQERRLKWYGHVMRREEHYVGRRAMVMKVQGRRKRGRPKRRWLDRVKDDIKEKGLSADDVYDRASWRRMSSYIDPT